MSHWPSAVERPNHETVLEEAARLVSGKRGSDYGHPLDNHTATAELFRIYYERKTGLHGLVFDADDVCWFNILQKCSRDAHEPARDNLVDAAGYAENIQIIRDEREHRAAVDVFPGTRLRAGR